MQIKRYDMAFSVCQVADYSEIELTEPFVFTGKTEDEASLVCPTALTPKNTLTRDDGWRLMRIQGVLDFSLVGILAKLSALLAQEGIGIFAISTYNTDYILVKAENFERALQSLAAAGYIIE